MAGPGSIRTKFSQIKKKLTPARFSPSAAPRAAAPPEDDAFVARSSPEETSRASGHAILQGQSVPQSRPSPAAPPPRVAAAEPLDAAADAGDNLDFLERLPQMLGIPQQPSRLLEVNDDSEIQLVYPREGVSPASAKPQRQEDAAPSKAVEIVKSIDIDPSSKLKHPKTASTQAMLNGCPIQKLVFKEDLSLPTSLRIFSSIDPAKMASVGKVDVNRAGNVVCKLTKISVLFKSEPKGKRQLIECLSSFKLGQCTWDNVYFSSRIHLDTSKEGNLSGDVALFMLYSFTMDYTGLNQVIKIWSDRKFSTALASRPGMERALTETKQIFLGPSMLGAAVAASARLIVSGSQKIHDIHLIDSITSMLAHHIYFISKLEHNESSFTQTVTAIKNILEHDAKDDEPLVGAVTGIFLAGCMKASAAVKATDQETIKRVNLATSIFFTLLSAAPVPFIGLGTGLAQITVPWLVDKKMQVGDYSKTINRLQGEYELNIIRGNRSPSQSGVAWMNSIMHCSGER